MGVILGNINEISFFWYGLIISITIILSLILILRNKSNDIDFENIIDISIYTIIIGLITGRILFVINNLVIYKRNMWEIFYLWEGGFSIYGVALGALITIVIYCKIKKIQISKIIDTLTPGMVILLIGEQIANFINQNVIGKPGEGRLSMYVEYAFRPIGVEQYDFFYPVAIYQAFWLIVVLIAGLYLKNRIKNYFDGMLFYISIFLIAFGRFIFGFYYLGGDKGLQIEQIFLGIIMLLLIGVIFYQRKDFKKNKEWN